MNRDLLNNNDALDTPRNHNLTVAGYETPISEDVANPGSSSSLHLLGMAAGALPKVGMTAGSVFQGTFEYFATGREEEEKIEALLHVPDFREKIRKSLGKQPDDIITTADVAKLQETDPEWARQKQKQEARARDKAGRSIASGAVGAVGMGAVGFFVGGPVGFIAGMAAGIPAGYFGEKLYASNFTESKEIATSSIDNFHALAQYIHDGGEIDENMVRGIGLLKLDETMKESIRDDLRGISGNSDIRIADALALYMKDSIHQKHPTQPLDLNDEEKEVVRYMREMLASTSEADVLIAGGAQSQIPGLCKEINAQLHSGKLSLADFVLDPLEDTAVQVERNRILASAEARSRTQAQQVQAAGTAQLPAAQAGPNTPLTPPVPPEAPLPSHSPAQHIR